ncbi:MAG: RuvC-like Holliday junction resolvase [Wendovervirus sonii]|uniref:RuvC-like Holliday junction resolvase n=1 Tax=phage Lak_Megaphage_Sonny TaxID=3109229 RepID=A0ABZ0Z675_9CAUD|nr:MAG: RuvC-like Holliday junction resolvase [phage Lak_Megaphage_Sonny]
MKSIFIGFDFSINKPACTILYDKKFYHFIWPLQLDDKYVQRYIQHNVYVRNRNLQPMSTKDKNSQIVLEHTKRSVDLANMIIADLDDFIDNIICADKNTPIYVSSEGLSFGSKGNQTENLATYKGVLLGKLYEHYYGRLYGLYTYAPISIKSTAKCAGKDKIKSKTAMIESFMKETEVKNDFYAGLIKKEFKSRTAYIQCIDDIVDSYWALVTMLKKEGFIKK